MDDLAHSVSGFRPTSGLIRRIAPLMVAGLALGGCSFLGNNVDKLDLACPKVGILRDASKVTVFRPGSGRAITDVAARAVIADYVGNCTYDETGVSVDLSLILVGERGPAMTGSQLPLNYFVAISTPAGAVATRQLFPTTIEFQANGPRAGSREDLQPHIPLPKGQDARGYQLLVGFELTRDQLDYNRRSDVK